MPELRPLVAEGRVDLEPGGVDDGLGLVRVDRADRVDDSPARPNARGGRQEQLQLQLGKGFSAPAQVGASIQDSEARSTVRPRVRGRTL